ncbi:MAG: hypothetical protein RLZ98_2038 [Pseudomonadota bacterium]
MHRNSACEVCCGTSTKEVTRYSHQQWPLLKCIHCGFLFLRDAPEYEELDGQYAWQQTHREENMRRKRRLDGAIDQTTRWRLGVGKWLDKNWEKSVLPSTGNVLDIGSGGACRIPPGPTPYGIEISEALASAAAPEFEARGGSVFHGPAVAGLQALAGIEFDAIMMRSYLEHESQPRLVLERAHKLLRDGGKILVRVPNFDSPNRLLMGRNWCGFRFPDTSTIFHRRRWRNWLCAWAMSSSTPTGCRSSMTTFTPF